MSISTTSRLHNQSKLADGYKERKWDGYEYVIHQEAWLGFTLTRVNYQNDVHDNNEALMNQYNNQYMY